MLTPILNDRGEMLDGQLLSSLRAVPKNKLLIAADLHWTLCEGGVSPSSDELAFFQHIHEMTEGGLVIVSNSDIADVDLELAPLKVPMIGRGHLQVRLDPSCGIEPRPDSPFFGADAIADIRRFAGHLPGFSIRFSPPYMDFTVKLDRNLAVADWNQRVKMLDQIYVYIEAYFMDIGTVEIQRGFDYLYVSHGAPDKGQAALDLMQRYPDRILLGLGDEASKEGPMLRAINAARGYAFYVASPFNYNSDRSYTHDTLADHRAALALLATIFDYRIPARNAQAA